MVRPLKYSKEETPTKFNASFYIHPTFVNTWKKLTELAASDDNEEFNKYINEIEGEDVRSNRQQGKRGLYLRWIITRHVIKNISKLKLQ